ncbi:MAG: trypsin-like peptidase domain-containing protein [Planctomycetes bacterium]|nr:trypsin-like peptidase domain-containing protein [Planctomycetota bacterium]
MSTPTVRLAGALVALALAAPVALAQDPETPLESGREVQGALPHEGRPYRTFTIEVPEGARRLEVVVSGQEDVDLYLKEGGPIIESWADEATAKGDSPAKRERVVLTAGGAPPLRAGTYWIDVVHGDGDEGAPTRFTIKATITTAGPGPGATPMAPRPPAPADDGQPTTFGDDFSAQVVLHAEAYRTFVMEVAPDVAEVELTLRGAGGDCDVYVRHAEPMTSWDEADARANGPEADETLVLRRGTAPRLRSGVYYIDVARAVEGPVTVTFAATFTRGFDGPEATGARPEPSSEAGVDGEVRRDALFSLELPPDGPDYRTYTIFVPKGARSLLVTAAGADRDVDLYLRHGKPINNYRVDPDHRANGARSDEQLYVDGASTPPLRPGKYYLDIARAVPAERVSSFEVGVRFDAARPAPIPATPGPVQALAFGERVAVALRREERKAARFSFEVPTGARRLHVAVLGATRDIDLFLRRGEVVTDYDEPSGFDWRAVSSRLNERLVVDEASSPPLAPGTYYLDVASLVAADAHIRFTLLVTLDAPPPLGDDDLRLPPYPRTSPSALERVLQATVQVESERGAGSGTCLTPSGLIVTNYHVLEHEGKLQTEEVLVSFPDAWDEPPEQVFVARVVAHDARLDLALLQLERDVFDRPLPPGRSLPWVPVGDAARVRLGDVLVIAGYPALGGEESRSSISISRGVVAGFNTDGQRRTWLKTDATINSGNSGGSAYWQDERGEYHYVGVPTHKLYEDGGALGFCRPTSCIPAEWLERVKGALGE